MEEGVRKYFYEKTQKIGSAIIKIFDLGSSQFWKKVSENIFMKRFRKLAVHL